MRWAPRLAAFWAVARAGVASASLPAVWLDTDGCERLAGADVRRMFAADLGVELASAEPLMGTSVSVHCDGSTVRLVATDRVSQKQLERIIDVHTVEAEAEARLVAIAASELVLASWAELAVNPEPRVRAQGPRVEEPVRRAGRAVVEQRVAEAAAGGEAGGLVSAPEAAPEVEEPELPMLRIVGFVSTRQIFGVDGRLWGGGVRLGHDLPGVVAWSSDVLLESGTMSRDVDVSAAMGSGNVFFRHRWQTLTGRLGAGLRFGLTTSSTGDAPIRSTVAPWGWPQLVMSASWRFLPGLVADFRAEGGYTVLPVASPEPGATLRGAWLALQAGLGAAF